MLDERFIGLDVGNKRIGVSLSDRLLLTAQPLKTINRMPEVKAIEELSKIIKENGVTGIVVGLPKNMNGSIGFQADNVQNFAELLEQSFNLDIIFEDERLSSRQAERFLSEQNVKPSRNKGLIDVASAAIILQLYLDKRRIQNGRS
ncbi:MAG: Holliday junction resolvase RuvX [bacterium]